MLQTVGEKVSLIASAMVNVGLAAHGRAGIYAVNCPEWMEVMLVRRQSVMIYSLWPCTNSAENISDLLKACNRLTVYTVPLYDTLGELRAVPDPQEDRVSSMQSAVSQTTSLLL